MPILESASVHDIKHLLEMFPIANIRRSWPDLKGTERRPLFRNRGEESPYCDPELHRRKRDLLQATRVRVHA
jgi:hypothetical protein